MTKQSAMIDTVILSIPYSAGIIEMSGPLPWTLYSSKRGFTKYIMKETPIQKADGLKRPSIRKVRRGPNWFLEMQISIPKLLYMNNVDEVSETDFKCVLETLKLRLQDYGIRIFTHVLRQATVIAFHPSKNILLSEGYTSSSVLIELKKINLTKRMDLTGYKFEIDGHSLQLYTQSHSVVIYDKVADLRKNKKRAVDKDKSAGQLSLFHCLKKARTEVLRIEVRLIGKRKMNSVLVKNGLPKYPTFEQVFRNDICKTIVNNYWHDLIADKNLFLFNMQTNPKQTLKKLLLKFPAMKPKEAIHLVGLDQLCRDENGVRELRQMIEKRTAKNNWYNQTSKAIQKLNSIQDIADCQGGVRQVNDQLKSFEALKIYNLLCKEL
ncbi:MAG: hypothetical protein AAB649_07630 [Patescibacteria group bacterium]